MDIIEKSANGTSLRFTVNSNEESLFSLLKPYLDEMKDVEVVGYFKEHHLVDKTEFLLKTKKDDAEKVFKKALADVKKSLASMKLK